MKRKNLFAGLALCSLALGAHAISPDDAQVCVVMKDWSTKNYKISDLKRIVFHESELGIIDRSDNETKSAYSDVRKLWFIGTQLELKAPRRSTSLWHTETGSSMWTVGRKVKPT